MPKTKEEIKEYRRQYYLKNKEKELQRQKEYYIENKQKELQRQKEYKNENKDKIAEYKNRYNKEYLKTPKGIKINRITNWKIRGVIHDNYDELYDYYFKITNCEECGCELDKCNKSRKCLDHDHETGQFRNVLCHSCNIKRG